MQVTAEIHVSGYAPIVERFKSKRDALTYIDRPSWVTPLGGESHPASYWPCWPDAIDRAESYAAGSAIAFLWRGVTEGTEHGYPDYVVTVGKRGALQVSPA